jgi:hypothetical protein
MLKVSTTLLAVLLSLALVPCVNGQGPKERVYIWDFVDNKGQQADLTAWFTSEFEEALSHANCYQVLERRQFDRLLANIKNEKAIADLNDLSKESQSEIKKITNAQIVVFGKVDDDIESGQIKISVSFQHFDSSKKVWSTRIPRGKRLDPESRENAMKGLVKEICDNDMSSRLRLPSPVPLRYEERDVLIELVLCKMEGNIVTCEFVLENKSQGNRDIWLFTTDYYNKGSRMYDESNNEYRSFVTQLGNKSNGERSYAKIMAVPQQKIRAVIKFKEVARQINSISLLRILVGIADPDQHIFGNLDRTFEARMRGTIPIAK